jgi:hypothetical protein
MKIEISVEILNKGRPLTAKDLKAFGAISFVKRLPKVIKRAIKAVCWPFDAKVDVHIIDLPSPSTQGKS